MEKQQMVMREDFGTERHADPFSSLLGGELLPPVLRKIQKNKVEQKSSKLTKSPKVSVNEVESTSTSTSKKPSGEGRRSGRFNSGGIVRIKETKTKTSQINTTELQNLKVQQQQQQQQQHQEKHQQQNGHEVVGKWVPVKGGISQ